MAQHSFQALEAFLKRVPGIVLPIGKSNETEKTWWVKFGINIQHPLAWNVVQEFGHVLNYISLEERLPTVFMPVSPPPYMNGGPEQFLSWVIEARDPAFTPDKVVEFLEGRLPRPVDDESQWKQNDT